jgi:hypothetical protein
LRHNTREWSTMVNSTAAGSKIAVFADFRSAFLIADRIGMGIEISARVR